jgi:hypothetical protein
MYNSLLLKAWEIFLRRHEIPVTDVPRSVNHKHTRVSGLPVDEAFVNFPRQIGKICVILYLLSCEIFLRRHEIPVTDVPRSVTHKHTRVSGLPVDSWSIRTIYDDTPAVCIIFVATINAHVKLSFWNYGRSAFLRIYIIPTKSCQPVWGYRCHDDESNETRRAFQWATKDNTITGYNVIGNQQTAPYNWKLNGCDR